LKIESPIDIYSRRIFINETEIFENYIYKSQEKYQSNLKIFNRTDNKLMYSEDNVTSDNFNIRIEPNMVIKLRFILADTFIDKIDLSKNDLIIDYRILDNIINVNKNDFFKNYSNYYYFSLDGDQYKTVNLNYGVVKLIDDLGFIFSEINSKYSLKKNYDSYTTENLPSYQKNIEIFKINFSRVMKLYERIYKKL